VIVRFFSGILYHGVSEGTMGNNEAGKRDEKRNTFVRKEPTHRCLEQVYKED
jgi:hypothetical protein